MTPITTKYKNPTAIVFDCPKESCDATPGVMCYGDMAAADHRYQHWFHAERVALAEETPQTREEWQARLNTLRDLVLRGRQA